MRWMSERSKEILMMSGHITLMHFYYWESERSFMIGQVTGINSLHKVAENVIRIRNLFSVTLFPVYGMIGLQHISNGLQENTLCT